MASLPQAVAVLTDPAECGPAFIALPQDVQAEAFDYPVEFFEPRVHQVPRPRRTSSSSLQLPVCCATPSSRC